MLNVRRLTFFVAVLLKEDMTGSLVSFPVLTILALPSPTAVWTVVPAGVHGTVAIATVRGIIGDISCLDCQATKMTEAYQQGIYWQLQPMPVGTVILNCVYSSHSEHLSPKRAKCTFPKSRSGCFPELGKASIV